MKPLLEVQNLQVAYNGVGAVNGVSLTVQRGGITTVIGANGAGKSTLVNAIVGLLPAQGRLIFDGVDVGKLPVERRVEHGLCLVSEKRELFTTMNVEDNLLLGGFRFRRQSRSVRRTQLDYVYTLFPRLRERRAQLSGTLSGGERQMLAMGRALMSKPTLLMLDEPSLGLAPLIVREIFQIIATLKAENVSILLIEQNARAALQISDYGLVLENGVVGLEGASRTLLGDPSLTERYLGSSASAMKAVS